MFAEILLLVMALLFLILGICLFLGKGAWLIAGYNTMPPEEKRRYDKKKLCRAAGSLCAVCAAALCALACLGYLADTGRMEEAALLPAGLGIAAVILAAVIAAGLFIRTGAKK